MIVASDKSRRYVELGFGLALFAVNAAFSLLLYLEIASGVWYYQAMYGTLAIVFDASMLLLWIRGLRSRNIIFIAIAVAFACISLVASSASALTIIERKVRIVEVDTTQVDDLRDALRQADADIETNRNAIEKTPPDFTTRLRELNVIANELRVRRDAAQSRLTEAQQTSASKRSTATSMFTLVAKALRVSDEKVMLPFLLGTSLMLLVGSFALTAPPRVVKAATLTSAIFGNTSHYLKEGKALCGAVRQPQTAGRVVGCVACMLRKERST